MNRWIKLSIEYANQRSYLDDLFKVYPTIPEGIRDINEDIWSNVEKFFNRKNLQKTVNYLQARKYTLKKRGESGYTLRLTKKGRDLALRRIFQDFQIPRPAHWDGWWHVVLFDIPNRRKHARDSLRKRLKTLGFYPLQESVFVFPYPCDDEITFFTSLYNIGDYVRMIKTNKLLSDDDIREFFALA